MSSDDFDLGADLSDPFVSSDDDESSVQEVQPEPAEPPPMIDLTAIDDDSFDPDDPFGVGAESVRAGDSDDELILEEFFPEQRRAPPQIVFHDDEEEDEDSSGSFEGMYEENLSDIASELGSDDSFTTALTGRSSARSRSRGRSGARMRRRSRSRSASARRRPRSAVRSPSPEHERMQLGRTEPAQGEGQARGRPARLTSDARVARCIQNEQDAPELRLFDAETRRIVEESKNQDILNHEDAFDTRLFIWGLNQSLEREKFTLKDYQRSAANWMFTLYKLSLEHGGNPRYQLTAADPSGPYGACLGDSVGTGKTIQTVVTLDLIRNHINHIKAREVVRNDAAKILIVTPSVQHTIVWNEELQRVFSAGNGFNNTTIQQVYKAEISHGEAAAQLRALNTHQRTVYICTYSLFQQKSHNYAQMRDIMKGIRWGCIVVDEAHEMRNGARLYQELKEFTSDFRIALTATPIANKPENMICLFNFVVPGAIKNNVNNPQAARRAIAPFFLFRSPHTSYRTHCYDIAIPLSPLEQASYTKVLATEMTAAAKINRLRYATLFSEFPIAPTSKDHARNEYTVVYSINEITLEADGDDVGEQISIFKQLVKKSDREDALEEFNRDPVIYTFTKPEDVTAEELERIKQNVNDALAMRGLPPSYNVETIVHEKYSFKSLLNELISVKVDGDFVSRASLPDSTKLVCIRSVLETAQLRGEKVLIFVKMINMLHLIEFVINNYYQGDPEYGVAVLYGGTKKEDREKIIKDFKTTSMYRCLILTSRIGGQGLNFQEANHVIFADLEYNYSETEQAVGRVQRTSQMHPDVYTYRFVTPMTIDSAIASIQDRKRGQNEEIRKVGESKTDESVLRMMNQEELQLLATRQAQEAIRYQQGVDRATTDNTCTWQRILDMTEFQNMLVDQTSRWTDRVIQMREDRAREAVAQTARAREELAQIAREREELARTTRRRGASQQEVRERRAALREIRAREIRAQEALQQGQFAIGAAAEEMIQIPEDQMREAALGSHGTRIAPRRPHIPTEREMARERRRQRAIARSLEMIRQRLRRLEHDAEQVNLRRNARTYEPYEHNHEEQQRELAEDLEIQPQEPEEPQPRGFEERKGREEEEDIFVPPSPEPMPAPLSDSEPERRSPSPEPEREQPRRKKKKKDKDKDKRKDKSKKKKKKRDRAARSPSQESDTSGQQKRGRAEEVGGRSEETGGMSGVEASIQRGLGSLSALLSGKL